MNKFKIVPQSPRGMHDLIKEDAELFLGLFNEIIRHSYLYGFEYIRTPVVEKEEIFTASLGASTDVIEKEMFHVERKEKGEKYVLRPEGTASIARAYLQNGMHSWPQPVRLFYFGPMFRYEKPQAGRYREHYQWGLEVLNSEDPIYDAKIIQVFDRFFKKLKLKDFIFKINSIGCLNDRNKYKQALKRYYRKHLKNLCEDCKRRYAINPLRMLDCKNEKDQEIKKNAPILVNHLCKQCEEHFKKVLEYIEELDIPYELDSHLVRGFDYYSRTVFEIFFVESPIAIGGGGRYDYLIKFLGGKQTPGVGGALGIERLMEIVKLHQINLKVSKKPEIFIAYAAERAKSYAFFVYDFLLRHNINVAENFAKTSLTSQLEYADKLGVKYCIIIGHQEMGSRSVILKNMLDKTQETIPIDGLIEELKSRLK